MKITFLGTADGVKRPGRRNTSTMVQVGDSVYFIDMGTTVMADLVNGGIPTESVKAVFFTHMHGDHTSGLFEFIDLYNWYYRGEPKIFLTDERSLPVIREWNNILEDHCDAVLDVVTEGTFYNDGTVKVTAIRNHHTKTSFSFIFEAEGKKILFSGDLGGDGDKPEEFSEHMWDLAVIEGSHPDPMGFEDILRKTEAKQVYFNHIEPHREERISMLAEMLAPTPVIATVDGMAVEV